MTGFGKGVSRSATKKFTVEIKSLNSKQLDLVTRLPNAYREFEPEIRNACAAALQRGKVEVALSVECLDASTDATINLERAAAYKLRLEEMAKALSLPQPADWYATLLRCPDIFHSDNADTVPEDDAAALSEAYNAAIAAIRDFRAKEGVRLDEFFRLRIENIRNLLKEIPRYETERIARIRTRMEDALKQIPFADYDRGRYEQEMIFYIEKLDITEEKQRLTQHLDYFIETLKAPEGQGKKLGFIAQEMGREINTLGSKSNHAEMQITVVKMKDELEQIKEQVLNAM